MLTALQDIKIPAQAFLFFQECIEVVQMDILYGEEFFNWALSPLETEPWTDKFEQFGIDTRTFLFHAGSYFQLQTLIVA